MAENKVDLFQLAGSTADEAALARKRQQIFSLMQQFPFVRQCIKCSAQDMLRVDNVFLKAQQAVLYPFSPPLYDLETARLTIECQRALTRIFRIYDTDFDGLLSEAELDRFQRETYPTPVFDQDFVAIKKMVNRHAPGVLQDGKFTVAGFCAIFDIFLSQNRLDVVWQALREYHYDDDLNLHIPETVLLEETSKSAQKKDWKLSSSARKFLTSTFHQFDSDQDGKLTGEDMAKIFSILPSPNLPPWLRPDVFSDCFAKPKGSALIMTDSPSSSGVGSDESDENLIVPPAMMAQSLSQSGLSILSASDSLPSVDMVGSSSSVLFHHKALDYLEWMGLWHSVAAVSPAVARAELFRLGHLEAPRGIRGKKKKEAALKKILPPPLKSREIRVLVLGSAACGKTALIDALCQSEGLVTTEATTRAETSCAHVKLKRARIDAKKDDEDETEIVVHLSFTNVPETKIHDIPRDHNPSFDLAMLAFDCTLPSSWNYVCELETSLLDTETPRVFVVTKADGSKDLAAQPVLENAQNHCQEQDLEPPVLTKAATVTEDEEERKRVLDHLARSTLRVSGVERLRARPYEEQKKRDAARRRKMMWLGSIVGVGVVVAVGVGLLLGGSTKTAKDQKAAGFGWLRSWFNGAAKNATPQEA